MQRRTISTPVESAYSQPDERGYYGIYGGQYVPETLMGALEELTDAYQSAQKDAEFQSELSYLLTEYAGRKTPLFKAERLTTHYQKGTILLKREDLLHTGAHKINNTLGQILLARRMGKKRIIAETGAGQHGVATATVAALFGLECVVYMGQEDIHRQSLNVFRMKMLGARVEPVLSGAQTLKDATNEAIRDWVTQVKTTHYIIGSVIGPHPYPMMVRDFQSVIGKETQEACLSTYGRLPSHVIACIGGGSNGMGIFFPFLGEPAVQLIGIEAAGYGLTTNQHSASLTKGSPGVFHGSLIRLLMQHDGQICLAHSISAGLDYPGTGPEHGYLYDTQRVRYESVTDSEALDAFQLLCRLEGILPALESAHALAYLEKLQAELSQDDLVVICLSGRGDKDVYTVAKAIGYHLET